MSCGVYHKVKVLSYKKSSKHTVATVQMAPMIDMVFLLLVFFMCVSSISQAGRTIEVDLPESIKSEVADDLSSRVVVSIDASGAYFLNGMAASKSQLTASLVAMREQTPRLKMNIRSDRNTEYKSIRTLMKLAAESGIDDFVYSTYQSKKS